MPDIHSVTRQTDNRFVNLYLLEASSRTGRPIRYNVASRAPGVDTLKLSTHENHPDGVSIYALYGAAKDRVVLIRQYRYTIDDYIYELPAGLCEPGEEFHTAAIREMKEETGLSFTPLRVDPLYEAPRFTTIGMCDESVATVYGYADGTLSSALEEDAEDITPLLADRDEVRRILREEKVAMQCAYQMMHFLHDEEPFAFLK